MPETQTPHLPIARPRRVPQQQRSRDKLRRVMEAADTVLARDGAVALSMARVAEEAGVAVGSIYAYLPDKEAIVEALALGYWTAFAERVAAVADADAVAPVANPVDAVFDTLVACFRGRPGFRALWYSALRTEQVREATRGVRDEVAGSVKRILATHWPKATAADRSAAAETLVLVGDGLLREAFRRDDVGDPAVLAEGRLVLRAYVAARLSPDAPGE